MSAQLVSLRGQGGKGSRPQPDHQVVLLAGGKAGQGTSTVAALLAILSAAEGALVLLVDAGTGANALPVMLGVERETIPARSAALLEERVVPISDTLSLLPVGVGASAGEHSAGERRALLRWLPPLYARYDLVVVDGGSRLESVMALSATPPAKLFVVTTGERNAITSTYALIKALETRTPGAAVEVLVNGAAPHAALTSFRELDAATQLFLDRKVGYAGAVPDDAGLRSATLAGIPVQQAAIDSPVVAAIQQLGARVRRELVHRSPVLPESRFSHWR
jgi:flagellar biosynthesis protein FlhG